MRISESYFNARNLFLIFCLIFSSCAKQSRIPTNIDIIYNKLLNSKDNFKMSHITNVILPSKKTQNLQDSKNAIKTYFESHNRDIDDIKILINESLSDPSTKMNYNEDAVNDVLELLNNIANLNKIIVDRVDSFKSHEDIEHFLQTTYDSIVSKWVSILEIDIAKKSFFYSTSTIASIITFCSILFFTNMCKDTDNDQINTNLKKNPGQFFEESKDKKIFNHKKIIKLKRNIVKPRKIVSVSQKNIKLNKKKKKSKIEIEMEIEEEIEQANRKNRKLTEQLEVEKEKFISKKIASFRKKYFKKEKYYLEYYVNTEFNYTLGYEALKYGINKKKFDKIMRSFKTEIRIFIYKKNNLILRNMTDAEEELSRLQSQEIDLEQEVKLLSISPAESDRRAGRRKAAYLSSIKYRISELEDIVKHKTVKNVKNEYETKIRLYQSLMAFVIYEIKLNEK